MAKTAKTAKKKTATAGKGKKMCPKCNAVLGARTQQCECGHKFKSKTKKPATKRRKSQTATGIVGQLQVEQKRLQGQLEAIETALGSYQ